MKLYGFPRTRSMRALWALEEAGLTYDYIVIKLMKGEGRMPPFAAMNPSGKVPVLVDGNLVLTESAAICLYIAGKVPERQLVPAESSSARHLCNQWCFFAIGELEQPLWTMRKHSAVLPSAMRVPAVIETAKWEFQSALGVLLKTIDKQHFIAGDCFSIADILIGHTLLWATHQNLLSENATLESYMARLFSRPAFLAAQRIEDERASLI